MHFSSCNSYKSPSGLREFLMTMDQAECLPLFSAIGDAAALLLYDTDAFILKHWRWSRTFNQFLNRHPLMRKNISVSYLAETFDIFEGVIKEFSGSHWTISGEKRPYNFSFSIEHKYQNVYSMGQMIPAASVPIATEIELKGRSELFLGAFIGIELLLASLEYGPIAYAWLFDFDSIVHNMHVFSKWEKKDYDYSYSQHLLSKMKEILMISGDFYKYVEEDVASMKDFCVNSGLVIPEHEISEIPQNFRGTVELL